MRKQSHKSRVLGFGIFAVALFILVAFKLRFAEFEFSMLELMLLLLGMFSLAVGLMVWQVIYPISKKLSKKDLAKIF